MALKRTMDLLQDRVHSEAVEAATAPETLVAAAEGFECLGPAVAVAIDRLDSAIAVTAAHTLAGWSVAAARLHQVEHSKAVTMHLEIAKQAVGYLYFDYYLLFLYPHKSMCPQESYTPFDGSNDASVIYQPFQC